MCWRGREAVNVNDNSADQKIACVLCDNSMTFGAASPAFTTGPEAMTPLAVVERVALQVGWTKTAQGWKCGAHGLKAV